MMLKIISILFILSGCSTITVSNDSTQIGFLQYQNSIYKEIIRRQLEVLAVLTEPDVEVRASTIDNIVKDSKKLLQELDEGI